MTIGELRAAIKDLPDDMHVAEICRIVREPIPKGAQFVATDGRTYPVAALDDEKHPVHMAAGDPVFFVPDSSCSYYYRWPTELTPGEVILGTLRMVNGKWDREHHSLGLYAGGVWK